MAQRLINNNAAAAQKGGKFYALRGYNRDKLLLTPGGISYVRQNRTVALSSDKNNQLKPIPNARYLRARRCLETQNRHVVYVAYPCFLMINSTRLHALGSTIAASSFMHRRR